MGPYIQVSAVKFKIQNQAPASNSLSSRYIYNKVAEQYQFGYSINKNEQTRNRPGYTTPYVMLILAPAEACEPAAPAVTQAALYFYTATLPLRIKDPAPNDFRELNNSLQLMGGYQLGVTSIFWQIMVI